MKKLIVSLFVLLSIELGAQTLTEGFDNVATLYSPTGWWAMNKSNPSNGNIWRQDVGNFTAYSGAANSSIITGWFCTDTVGTGNASNWLFTPPLTINNGDTISFYTISYNNTFYQDRLEVRLNAVNSDTLVGTTDTSVGHFTFLAKSINPTLSNMGYPLSWTKFNVIVTGFSGGLSRIAFRYNVPNTGGSGADGSVVGIDDFKFTQGFLATNEIANASFTEVYPNPATEQITVTAGNNTIEGIFIYSADGKLYKQIGCNCTSVSIDLKEMENGIYSLVIHTSKGISTKKLIKTN